MINILDTKGKTVRIHGDLPVEITEDSITIGAPPAPQSFHIFSTLEEAKRAKDEGYPFAYTPRFYTTC